jgi:hypothetical protein
MTQQLPDVSSQNIDDLINKKLSERTSKVYLPDGSRFIQLILPEIAPAEVLNYMNAFASIIRQYSQEEVRFLFATKETARLFLSGFAAILTMSNLTYVHGKSTYFEITSLEISEDEGEGSETNLAYIISRAVDLKVVQDLMVNSFAINLKTGSVIIERKAQILEAYNSPDYYSGEIFQITDKMSGNILACFVLQEAFEEVQLHSVAGRPLDPILSRRKNKLEIIMHFVKAIMKKEFPGKTLTFNSSGAADLYRKLGIRESSRYGVVIKPRAKAHPEA